MQLNITTDYAIRLTLYLSTCDKPTTSSELSSQLVVPQNYVSGIMKKLISSGIAASHPGISGGYFLIKEPHEITMYDIIAVMENTTRINRCLEPDRYCSRHATDTCPVRKFYVSLQNNIDENLKTTTLADLIEPTI